MRYTKLIVKFINRFIVVKKYVPSEIKSSHKLIAGKMSFHNGNLDIRGDQEVFIGSYCAFGKNVSIITSNHDYNYLSIQGTFYNHYFQSDHPGVLQYPPNKARTKGRVEIGNDVWIADNVTILSGVSIGNGACIGNNSIVTKNIEPYSINAGIPAKEIKKRYDSDKIILLEDLKWWNWNTEKIVRNRKLFFLNLNEMSTSEIKKIVK
jgi:acetyltransferase-like isoleucine patch superfamily enzyme